MNFSYKSFRQKIIHQNILYNIEMIWKSKSTYRIENKKSVNVESRISLILTELNVDKENHSQHHFDPGLCSQKLVEELPISASFH